MRLRCGGPGGEPHRLPVVAQRSTTGGRTMRGFPAGPSGGDSRQGWRTVATHNPGCAWGAGVSLARCLAGPPQACDTIKVLSWWCGEREVTSIPAWENTRLLAPTASATRNFARAGPQSSGLEATLFFESAGSRENSQRVPSKQCGERAVADDDLEQLPRTSSRQSRSAPRKRQKRRTVRHAEKFRPSSWVPWASVSDPNAVPWSTSCFWSKWVAQAAITSLTKPTCTEMTPPLLTTN